MGQRSRVGGSRAARTDQPCFEDFRARLHQGTQEVRLRAVFSPLERVLSLPAAQDALKKASLNQDQIRKAVSTLNDEELSRLADRARAVEQDVQGGLIVGLLALIGLIVVILVVVIVVTNK